jgi:subtilisin family serine protease
MKTTNRIIKSLVGAVLSLLVTLGLTLNAAAADPGRSANQTAVGARPGTGAAANAAEKFVEDELLVGFQPGTPGARADGIRNGLGATRIKSWSQINAEHWHLPPGLGVAQAIQALSANPNVLYAEPNYIVYAVGPATIPNDPHGDLWGLHNIGQTGGTADADIDALEAWQLPPGNGPVVVGVIDSGVDYNHEDLAGKIWTNPGEIPGNGIDDDGNGFIDDVHGWDFVNGDNDPMDDYGHGTHVSGTIGAIGNNGIGVIGVAGLNSNVKLMPLKFIGAIGSGPISAAVSAILYAASFTDASGNKVVRITSNSWITWQASHSLENAIKKCGALFVAAAGNDASDTVMYPAGYSEPNILSVGATDDDDALAGFSNYGSDWVDLGAPGVNILSTTPGNNYASMSGTSMATPHVSGVAALLMSQYPALSIDDIKAQILASVDPLPSLVGRVLTGGRLNAAKTLGAPELPPDTVAPAPVTDLVAAPDSATSVTLTWTAPGDDGNSGTAWLYDIRFSYSEIVSDDDFAGAVQLNREPGPQAAGSQETLTLVNLRDDTTYYFALKTMDAAGNVSQLSQVASATTPPGDWSYLRLVAGQDVGNYVSLGVTADGYWAVAYDDSVAGTLKCASYSGGGYFTSETVMDGGFGPSLAYSSMGEVSISHVDSSKKLWFAIKNGSTWTSTKVEGRDVNPYETSLAYDGAGEPVISYFKTGRRSYGLWVAQRSGSVWSTQPVDSAAAAVYNQLAVDPSGDLSIAYSHDSNGDGAVDTLKFAHWNGTAWDTSVLDAGGAYVTVAYDFTTGNPAVAHWNAVTGQLRFLRWDGAGWGSPEIVETAPSITGCSVAFGPDGKAYLAYGSDVLRLAIRDPDSGTWSVQTADPSTPGSLRNTLRGRPLGTPSAVAYRGPAEIGAASTVRLAIRQTPY